MQVSHDSAQASTAMNTIDVQVIFPFCKAGFASNLQHYNMKGRFDHKIG